MTGFPLLHVIHAFACLTNITCIPSLTQYPVSACIPFLLLLPLLAVGDQVELLGDGCGERGGRARDTRVLALELDREHMGAVLPAGTLAGRIVRRDPAGLDEEPFQDRDVADELLKLSGLLVQGGGADERDDERLDRVDA